MSKNCSKNTKRRVLIVKICISWYCVEIFFHDSINHPHIGVFYNQYKYPKIDENCYLKTVFLRLNSV